MITSFAVAAAALLLAAQAPERPPIGQRTATPAQMLGELGSGDVEAEIAAQAAAAAAFPLGTREPISPACAAPTARRRKSAPAPTPASAPTARSSPPTRSIAAAPRRARPASSSTCIMRSTGKPPRRPASP
jgi:hypothetical protein